MKGADMRTDLFTDCHPSVPAVADRLVGLAQSGELSVTEILNQPKPWRDLAGMAILGQDFYRAVSEGGQSCSTPVAGAFRVPPELAAVKVRLRTCGAAAEEKRPIRWKRPERRCIGQKRSTAAGVGPGLTDGEVIKLYADNTVEVEGPEAELALSDAWLALRQAGKGCVYAPREDMQRTRWTLEEVPTGEPKRSKRASA